MSFSDWTFGGLKERAHFRLQKDPRYTDKLGTAANIAVVKLMLFIRNTTSIFEASTSILQSGPDAGKFAKEYPLPEGTLWVDSLSFDGQPPLKLLDQRELVNTGDARDTLVGDPTGFYVYDTPEAIKIAVLSRRPGRVADLEFFGGISPAPMTDDDQPVPVFTENYSDYLEAFMVAYLKDGQFGEDESAMKWFAKWKDGRGEARVDSRANRVSKTQRVRDIP